MSQEDLWETAPAAMLLLEQNVIQRMNKAASRLLGVESPAELGRWPWSRLDERGLRKFEAFLSDAVKASLPLEIFNPAGERVYLRFQKAPLGGGRVVLSVEDLTEVREDVQALQAGYDEFIRVTTDLEKALITIEKQNMLLEKQASILQNEMRIAHAVQAQVFTQNFDHFRVVHAAG
ncbi:MAG: hypothetical protein HY042_10410, partial [Spirochaetia bacterium]|nr:hypothetical protein [Spirochaetia bacterium]